MKEIGFFGQKIGAKDTTGKAIAVGDVVHREDSGIIWSVEYDNTECAFVVFNQLNSTRRFSFDYKLTFNDCPIVVVHEGFSFHPTIIGTIQEAKKV